jgi:hypothetical protein
MRLDGKYVHAMEERNQSKEFQRKQRNTQEKENSVAEMQ